MPSDNKQGKKNSPIIQTTCKSFKESDMGLVENNPKILKTVFFSIDIILVRVTIAVIKDHEQKQLLEEKVYLVCIDQGTVP